MSAEITTTITIDGIIYDAEVGTVNSTHLGFEDHGMFFVDVDFEFSGSGQGIARVPDEKHLFGMLKGIITTVGVGKWEALPGKKVYVLRAPGRRLTSFILGIASLDGSRYYIFPT